MVVSSRVNDIEAFCSPNAPTVERRRRLWGRMAEACAVGFTRTDKVSATDSWKAANPCLGPRAQAV